MTYLIKKMLGGVVLANLETYYKDSLKTFTCGHPTLKLNVLMKLLASVTDVTIVKR